jgi:hypothetical protein
MGEPLTPSLCPALQYLLLEGRREVARASELDRRLGVTANAPRVVGGGCCPDGI